MHAFFFPAAAGVQRLGLVKSVLFLAARSVDGVVDLDKPPRQGLSVFEVDRVLFEMLGKMNAAFHAGQDRAERSKEGAVVFFVFARGMLGVIKGDRVEEFPRGGAPLVNHLSLSAFEEKKILEERLQSIRKHQPRGRQRHHGRRPLHHGARQNRTADKDRLCPPLPAHGAPMKNQPDAAKCRQKKEQPILFGVPLPREADDQVQKGPDDAEDPSGRKRRASDERSALQRLDQEVRQRYDTTKDEKAHVE